MRVLHQTTGRNLIVDVQLPALEASKESWSQAVRICAYSTVIFEVVICTTQTLSPSTVLLAILGYQLTSILVSKISILALETSSVPPYFQTFLGQYSSAVAPFEFEVLKTV